MSAIIKDSRSYHFNRPLNRQGLGFDRVLWSAIVAALLLHAGLIFGIVFEDNAQPSAAVQEVTTVLTESLEKNQQADFIANASQQGGGEANEVHRFENDTISPLADSQVRPTDDIASQQQQKRQQFYQQSYLRTTLSWQKINPDHDNKKDDKLAELEEKEQRLREQITTLETKISSNRQLLAKKTAVQTVSSNSTTTGEAAAYIENFRQQAYRVGNQQYPVLAREQGLSGEVRLLVIIDPTGKVKALRVLSSSGSALLDEAAKNSVRKAAPFGKFTPDMKDIVELRIIRTWRFGERLSVDAN